MAPYCASKFALEGLTASMAADYADQGVRVVSISPGNACMHACCAHTYTEIGVVSISPDAQNSLTHSR